jgi:hypothetical protein
MALKPPKPVTGNVGVKTRKSDAPPSDTPRAQRERYARRRVAAGTALSPGLVMPNPIEIMDYSAMSQIKISSKADGPLNPKKI